MLAAGQDLRTMRLLALVDAHKGLGSPTRVWHTQDAFAPLAKDDAVLTPMNAIRRVGRCDCHRFATGHRNLLECAISVEHD